MHVNCALRSDIAMAGFIPFSESLHHFEFCGIRILYKMYNCDYFRIDTPIVYDDISVDYLADQFREMTEYIAENMIRHLMKISLRKELYTQMKLNSYIIRLRIYVKNINYLRFSVNFMN